MRRAARAFALLIVIVSGAGSTATAQVSIGIQIGPPPPPRVVRVAPPMPAAESVWVDGYWYPVGKHYKWHEGDWTSAPYPRARRAPAGSRSGTTASGFTRDIGREIAAASNTITDGITSTIATAGAANGV